MYEITTQLLTLLLAALAMLISMGKVFVGRVEAKNEQDVSQAQIDLLRQEIENMREKSDIATRELVNDVMQRYMDENKELLERLHENDIERATLQTKLEDLQQRLTDSEAQWQKRITELETIIREKDERIVELERRMVVKN
jgi:chromosome segregation ATPase